jgi:hypothetical protein
VASFNYFYFEKRRKKSQNFRLFSHVSEKIFRQDKKIHQKKKKWSKNPLKFLFVFEKGGGGVGAGGRRGGRYQCFFSCLNFANFQQRKWENWEKSRQK